MSKVFKQEKDLSTREITKGYKFLCWWWLISTLTIFWFFVADMKTEKTAVCKPNRVLVHDTIYLSVEAKDIKLSDSGILHELTKQGCVLPTMGVAQAKIETLHYKSAICRENKNLFGIRTSKSKYVIGMNRGHCVYATYKDCIADYIRVQNRYMKNIDGKYAEAPGYLTALKTVR